MTINATPSGDPADDLEAQQFTVFLVEAATEEHAALLAGSAVSKDWHEALGPGDLERFRATFTQSLEGHG